VLLEAEAREVKLHNKLQNLLLRIQAAEAAQEHLHLIQVLLVDQEL
jgi:hypothetical protein